MSGAGGARRPAGFRDHPWCHAYSWALYLYPRTFRRRYGSDMARTFAVRLAEVRGDRRPLARARFLVTEFASLPAGATLERLRYRPPDSGPDHPPPWSRGEPLAVAFGELRLAARRLMRSPGFTVAAVLTLALGVGATTAVYTIVHSTVISPLPYPDSDRLVWLDHAGPGIGNERGLGMTDGLFVHYRDRISALEDISVWTHVEITLAGDEPERIRAIATTPSLFRALRTPAALGRVLTDEQVAEGSGAVVISHGLWTRRFGADPNVIGRAVEVNGLTAVIGGVMPREFEFPNPDIDMWAPLPVDQATTRFGGFDREGIARLAPGASREAAVEEMRAAIPGLADRFGVQRMLDETRLEPLLPTLKDHVINESQRVLWILLGSVLFVLLLACANVANLLLVRAESRQRETAVRRALGAGASRIAQYFLAEGLLLSVAGVTAGLLVAGLTLRAVVGFGPQHLPRLSEVSIDLPVLLPVVVILVTTTLLFGLVPALGNPSTVGSPAPPGSPPTRGSRLTLVPSLESGGRATAHPARSRGRNALVALQVALALVLLVSTGLMARSFARLTTLDPGFVADRVLTFRVGLNPSSYADQRSVVAFHREALDRIAALPGVEEAAATTCLPLCGLWGGTQLTVAGRPDDPDEVRGVVAVRRVSEAYFSAAGVPLVAGRLPGRPDQESGSGAAVISRELADSYWPGQDAIGQRFKPTAGGADWYTVVGIVENTPITGLADDPIPMAYLPLQHGTDRYASPRELSYAVKTSTRPQALLGPIRDVIRSLDAEVPLSQVTTLYEIVSEASAPTAFTTTVLGIAAFIALLLGVVGIYGVISYTVGRRAREIAIRMAVGARSTQVTRSVLAQGGRVTAAGLALGLLAALALTRVLDSLLYGISPTDPLTFIAMAALLGLVALAASYIPARRAARVDPSTMLRTD